MLARNNVLSPFRSPINRISHVVTIARDNFVAFVPEQKQKLLFAMLLPTDYENNIEGHNDILTGVPFLK